jgi:hypothetical protein
MTLSDELAILPAHATAFSKLRKRINICCIDFAERCQIDLGWFAGLFSKMARIQPEKTVFLERATSIKLE